MSGKHKSGQTEKVWLADPMTKHLKADGWFTQNMTAGFFIVEGKRVPIMKGVPDLFAAKRKHRARWIEWKIVRNGTIKFEDSQIEKFPLMMDQGVDIWIVCTDRPLANDYVTREILYKKILDEPNGHWMRDKRTWKYLI